MSPQPGSPLTDEHLQQINNALDAIKIAKVQIDLAKRAGIDVANAEDLNNQNEAKLRQIKQVYFPGR
jgi:predicted Ser/Thr protein kinase